MAVSAVTVKGGRLDEIKRIKSVEEVNDVKIRSTRCPRVNDKGIIEAWSWSRVASITIATYSAYVSYEAAKKRYDIAKRYWRLARDEWDHFYNNYRPLEKEELAEITTTPIPTPDYDKSSSGHTDAIDPIYANIESHRDKLISSYCVCPDAGVEALFLLSKSTIEGDLDNFSRRYEEDRTQRLDDIRWNHRTQAANRGRNLLQQSLKYANRAQAFYGDYADAMTSVAQGASKFVGWLDNRNTTKYNEVRGVGRDGYNQDNSLILQPTQVTNPTNSTQGGIYYDDIIEPTEVIGPSSTDSLTLPPVSFDPTGLTGNYEGYNV